MAYNPGNKHHSYEIPGGHYEEYDKDVVATFFRKFDEETNGEIIDWSTIGYQVRTDESGHQDYQLFVFANVKNTSRNIEDPGGGVTRSELVELDDFAKYINWGEIGQRIVYLIRDKFIV